MRCDLSAGKGEGGGEGRKKKKKKEREMTILNSPLPAPSRHREAGELPLRGRSPGVCQPRVTPPPPLNPSGNGGAGAAGPGRAQGRTAECTLTRCATAGEEVNKAQIQPAVFCRLLFLKVTSCVN